MFLIKSGKAEVTTIDPKDKRKLMLARLGPGEFFGEVSLIKNKPRTATVTALSDVELLTISKQSFDQLTKDHPEMVSLLEQTIEKRVEDTIKKIIGGKK
jgi:CRP-like cAMP-binding protein